MISVRETVERKFSYSDHLISSLFLRERMCFKYDDIIGTSSTCSLYLRHLNNKIKK